MLKKLAILSVGLIGAVASAATNFQTDSYDIYSSDVNGDGEADLVFIPKEKILLIAGDISIPVLYQDGDEFALLYSSGTYDTISTSFSFDADGKTPTTSYTIDIADLDDDGKNDIILEPSSGAVSIVYGSSSAETPSSVTSSTSYAGFENDSSTNYSTVSTNSGDAVLVSRNGVTMLVDSSGEPYNPTQSTQSTNSVGNYGGNFTVSAGGAAVYNLPIDLVSGPAGIKPPVSVNYYSQGGLGLMGRGWSLSATESITRCQPAGQMDAPDYSNSDTLCLNGDELVEIESGVFRKKVDDGTLVEEDSNTKYTAYLENGQVKTFNAVLYKSGSSSIVKAWYLGSVEQVGGASYSLSYSMSTSSGEALLTKITYGSHSVGFTYEERPDRRFGYDHGGAKFSRTKRLAGISTYGNSQGVANYTFHYSYNSRVDQSYLNKIQKCAGSLCFAPLAFNWDTPSENPSNFYSGSVVTEYIEDDKDQQIAFGDVDGNGTTDIIGYQQAGNTGTRRIQVHKSSLSSGIVVDSSGSRLYEHVNYNDGDDDNPNLLIADVDNDGIDDIAFYDGENIRAYPSAGGLGFDPLNTYSQDTFDDRNTQLMDVNGDGIQDLVLYRAEAETSVFYVYTGKGFGLFPHAEKTEISVRDVMAKTVFGDINGDGKSDMVRFFQGDDYVQIWEGGGTAATASFTKTSTFTVTDVDIDSISYIDMTLSDINGDGLADLVFADFTDRAVRIFPANGSGFSSYSDKIEGLFPGECDTDDVDCTVPVAACGVWIGCSVDEWYLPELRLLDINGDGRSDFIENNQYRLGQIDGTFANPITAGGVIGALDVILKAPPLSYLDDPSDEAARNSITLVDVNGDGAKDLVKYRNGNHQVDIEKGTSTDLRITSFTDSNAQETSVVYKQITDSEVYTQATPSWYVDSIGMSYNPATHLVYRQSTVEGDTYFKYGGAQTSLDDGYLGFQLFASVSDRDVTGSSTKSVIAVTYLDQRSGLVGKEKQVYKQVVTGSSDSVYDDVDIIGSERLAAYYNGDDLFHDEVDPLQGLLTKYYTYGADSSGIQNYARSINKTIGFSGVNGTITPNSPNSSSYVTDWGLRALINGITRPVLLDSSMTYYDPDDRENIITTEKVSNTYATVGALDVVRLIKTEVVKGDLSGNNAGDISESNVDGNYVSKVTTTPTYLSGVGSAAEDQFKKLLPAEVLTEQTALSTWRAALVNESLDASKQTTVFNTYYDNGLLETTYTDAGAGDEVLATFTYDAVGQVSQTQTENRLTGGDVRIATSNFSENTGFVLSQTNAEGHETTYSNHDKYGNPGTVQLGNGFDSSQTLTSTFSFDSLGRQTSATHPTGEIITTSYHRCTSTGFGCSATGLSENFASYTKSVSSLGTGSETYQYFDTRGLLIKTATSVFGGGYSVVVTDYDRHQRKVYNTVPYIASSILDDNVGDAQFYRHDVLDTLVRFDDGIGGRTDYDWVFEGNGTNKRTVSVRVDSSNNNSITRDTVETYNALDQLIEVKAPNGSLTQYLYDVSGNLVRQWYSKANYSATSPEANFGATDMHVIEKTYDARNRLISEIDPNTGETRYSYTPYGEVATLSTPRVLSAEVSEAQSFTYDNLSRMTAQKNADGLSCYYYDEAGSGASVGQMTESRYYTGSGVVSCGSEYTKTDGHYAAQKYTYNTKGLLVEHEQTITGAGTYYADYAYNENGQPVSKAWTGGDGGRLIVNYGYDSSTGVLTTVNDIDTGIVHWRLTSVDAQGNATGVTLGGVSQVMKDYNTNTGNLMNVTVSTGGTVLTDTDYTYNAGGFVTNMTDNAYLAVGDTYSEDYFYGDAAQRQLTSVNVTANTLGTTVTTANAFTYQYDSLGNIRSNNQMAGYEYTATAPHRLTAANSNTYVYNTDGNVTDDGRRTLTYGHNHLPTAIFQGDANSGTYRKSQFVYDASNVQLYRKDEGSTNTQENWNFGDMQLTKTGTDTEKVYTVASGVTIVVDTGSAPSKEAQYTVTNNIGSTHIVLDESGNTKQRIMYDPFGKPRNVHTSSSPTTIQDWSGFVSKDGFTSHEHMYELDLIHMNGRVYDPTIGRFLQADIIVQAPKQMLSYNRYAYVWNNPLGYTDPSGYVTTTDSNGEGHPSNQYATENNTTSERDRNSDDDDAKTGSPDDGTGSGTGPDEGGVTPEDANYSCTSYSGYKCGDTGVELKLLPQWVVDVSAGFGDGISFGLTSDLRDLLGTNGVVDQTSAAYTSGAVAGTVHIALTGSGLLLTGTRTSVTASTAISVQGATVSTNNAISGGGSGSLVLDTANIASGLVLGTSSAGLVGSAVNNVTLTVGSYLYGTLE